MKFTQLSFEMSVAASATTKPHNVSVTLTESDIDDTKIVECLVGGNSPRVRLQSNLRRADGGIPSTYTCTWEEFIVGKRGPRATTKSMTPEQIESAAVANAKTDPAYRARLLAALGLDQ